LEDWITERLGRVPGGRVLHIECGDGALVRRLNEAGFRATGADPATAMESATMASSFPVRPNA
jgi:2-polyprenyl-3-methyl-5-hydroxy-6-metoxy-1,4-benzoquinol methylase